MEHRTGELAKVALRRLLARCVCSSHDCRCSSAVGCGVGGHLSTQEPERSLHDEKDQEHRDREDDHELRLADLVLAKRPAPTSNPVRVPCQRATGPRSNTHGVCL